jgi:hypothetical protein
MEKDLLAQRAEQERSRGPLRLKVLDQVRQPQRSSGTETVYGVIGSSIPVVYRTRFGGSNRSR